MRSLSRESAWLMHSTLQKLETDHTRISTELIVTFINLKYFVFVFKERKIVDSSHYIQSFLNLKQLNARSTYLLLKAKQRKVPELKAVRLHTVFFS